jgi:hypothetical protein
MRRFSQADVDMIRQMAEHGFSGLAIARELSRPPLAIRAKCCALGIPLRPKMPEKPSRILVANDVMRLLRSAAEFRGVTPQKLATSILAAVALDNLIGAVLDWPRREAAVARKSKALASKKARAIDSKSAIAA